MKKKFTLKGLSAVIVYLALQQSSYAYFENIFSTKTCYTFTCPYWYVGAHIGVSHLHDDPAPGSGDSVDENGPGGTVLTGFQFDPFWGAELGFTKYHDSRETTAGFTVAKTEHYATYLAATARLPLAYQLSVIGKLGAAYSYANKIFSFGPSASSGAVSLYGGLGLAYSLTKSVDVVLQWAGVRGNDYTGSSELYSLGFNFAILP